MWLRRRRDRRGATLNTAENRLLGFGGSLLGLAGTLFGLGDAALHLLEALVASCLFGLSFFQALSLSGAFFGRFGPLFNLAQALLGIFHRQLACLSFVLEAPLCTVQVDGRRPHWRTGGRPVACGCRRAASPRR